jgi:DNA-binding winged helix-turn-helix (wHTH) protein
MFAGQTARRYRILGPVTATRDGHSLELGAQKQRAVLAALLVNANRSAPKENLFSLVWDEDPPRSSRNRLHVYISQLRALLGKEVIERAGAGYLLGVGPGEFDLHELEETVAAARGEEPESAAQLPRSALGMWRRPALGGPTEALIDAEARAWRNAVSVCSKTALTPNSPLNGPLGSSASSATGLRTIPSGIGCKGS